MERYLIGVLSGLLVIYATLLVDYIKVDDPVGAVAVHGFGGVFGTIAVGLFDRSQGLLTTGDFSLLKVQLLGAVVVIVWGLIAGTFIAKVCDKDSWFPSNRTGRGRGLGYVLSRYSCV